MRPPITHSAIISVGLGTFCAIPAGERKIPEPIVMPMTSATELQRPRVRGSLPAPCASLMRGKTSTGHG